MRKDEVPEVVGALTEFGFAVQTEVAGDNVTVAGEMVLAFKLDGIPDGRTPADAVRDIVAGFVAGNWGHLIAPDEPDEVQPTPIAGALMFADEG